MRKPLLRTSRRSLSERAECYRPPCFDPPNISHLPHRLSLIARRRLDEHERIFVGDDTLRLDVAVLFGIVRDCRGESIVSED